MKNIKDSTVEFGNQHFRKTMFMILHYFGFISWLKGYAWFCRDSVVGLAHQRALTLAPCPILALILFLTLFEQISLL